MRLASACIALAAPALGCAVPDIRILSNDASIDMDGGDGRGGPDAPVIDAPSDAPAQVGCPDATPPGANQCCGDIACAGSACGAKCAECASCSLGFLCCARTAMGTIQCNPFDAGCP